MNPAHNLPEARDQIRFVDEVSDSDPAVAEGMETLRQLRFKEDEQLVFGRHSKSGER